MAAMKRCRHACWRWRGVARALVRGVWRRRVARGGDGAGWRAGVAARAIGASLNVAGCAGAGGGKRISSSPSMARRRGR